MCDIVTIGGRAVCRHCRLPRGHDRRGLCPTCYRTPGVRVSYPSTSKYGRRSSVPNGGTLPAPTAAPPGSEEKLAVLEARAAAGELLFHPEDARDWVDAAATPIVYRGRHRNTVCDERRSESA